MQSDKFEDARHLLHFVRRGDYAGVSVGYRLAGEAQWPAQIDDAEAAIRWIRANASKHPFDAVPSACGDMGPAPVLR